MTQVPEYIASLKPYVPGKPLSELERELGITDAIKLASNENPLGPAPAAIEAMRRAAAEAHIYPDGAAHRLKQAIAEYVGQPHEDLVVGNGSNELLTLLVRTFGAVGAHAVMPAYSFIAYRLVLKAAGLTYTEAPVGEDFAIDVDALLAAITPQTKFIFVANSNNPTGTYLAASEIERLLEQAPPEVIMVIDEAYYEYVLADDYTSAMEMRHLRDRLVVTRTFSKAFGLGGARVGTPWDLAAMMDFVDRVREPFNCNLIGQAGATAALGDAEFLQKSIEVNERGRKIMREGLEAMADKGVTWTPSQTNFLLVHLGERDGSAVYDAMLQEGVIVRPMAGYGLPHSVRITIGTAEQCTRCLRALEVALG